MVSPFYPTNHTHAGIPLTQNEAIALFHKDQCMRTWAWLQRGGEFFYPNELEMINGSRQTQSSPL